MYIVIKNNKYHIGTFLDFKIGAQYALDSLVKKGIPLSIEFIDSEGMNSKAIDSFVASGKFENFDAIVGPITKTNFFK